MQYTYYGVSPGYWVRVHEMPSLPGTRDGPFWGAKHEMTLFLKVRSCKSRVWSTWSQAQTTDVMVISMKEINTSYAYYAL